MASPLDVLVNPMSRAEVLGAIYQMLAVLGINTTSWKPGAVVRTILTVNAAVMAAFTEQQALNARLGFAELSSGEWLKLVARYTYGLDTAPFEATFATGTLTLTNAGGGVYDVDAFDLIATNPDTAKSYRNTEAFHLGALATVADIPIIAVEVGSDSNCAAGTIVLLTTPLNGVSCTNPAQVAGRDAATDPEVRTLCGESLGNLSPFGPWDAYSYACKAAKRADGSALGITRTRLTKDGYGNVTIYVASSAGAVDSPDITIAQEAVAQNAEPQGVNATVVSAVAHVIDVAYEVWLYNTSGKTLAQIEAAILKQLTLFMATQPVSGNLLPPDTTGKVFASGIGAAIGAAMPEVIRAAISGGDITLAVNDVPVLGVVTATVHQVPTPEGHSV